MKGIAGSKDRRAPTRRIASWAQSLRDRLRPNTYVDYVSIPDESPSPYRARLSVEAVQTQSGDAAQRREVVRGELKTVYEVRCACGKRWFNPRFERVQLCPRCDRAVLLQPSD